MKSIILFSLLLISRPSPALQVGSQSAPAMQIVVNGLLLPTKEELKQIYLGQKRFDKSQKIVAIGSSQLLEKFARLVLDWDLDTYLIYWEKKTFAEGITAPKREKGDEEVLLKVNSIPGSIGYVSADADIKNYKNLQKVLDI